MNRKERRTQEKKSIKTPASRVPEDMRAKSATLKAQGMALKNSGREVEAVPVLIEALRADSSLADVHFTLAIMARTKPELKIDLDEVKKVVKNKTILKNSYNVIQNILRKRKQHEERLICQEEICRLFPDDIDEKANYAITLNLTGRKLDSLRILAELMNSHPDNRSFRGVFVNFLDRVVMSKPEPEIKKALQSCFDNIYSGNLHKGFIPWFNVVLHDPACAGLKEGELISSEDDFQKWLDGASHEKLAFINDRFFLDGIRTLIISDYVLEIFLTRIRRWLCINIERLSSEGRIGFFESFLCAMGEQSYLNEYLHTQTPAEKTVIDKIVADIKGDKLVTIQPIHAYSLVSCYQPLCATFPEHEIALRNLAKPNESFARLFKTQFLDPREEETLKSTLLSFGETENEVSKNVRAQYEENPYPRWVTCINYPTATDCLPVPESMRRQPWKILVAGCGTGRHAMGTAATYPNSHVTAIDLSRASLAYAMRKTNESGLAPRINFVHADILSMSKWPEQFDIIECSGVLHHMEDPFEGWRVLCGLLKPEGHFKVGLYSEAARTEIVTAREYVKTSGFPATFEGIRTCREKIMQRPPNDPMRKWLAGTGDFYATSLIRDLIFHVQEHRMTLPQIQEMLDKLGLSCTGMIITNDSIAKNYDSQFPGDPERKDLKNWHAFETKYPDTFRTMYQFWCRKH